MAEIYLHNTLTRKKEPLVTSEPGKISMYVCGPTTYNYIHLGNARPMVVFDTIRRYLEYRGFKVTYIQNFTDIDDKIINKAKETGEDPLKLARRFIDEYYHDAAELNVRRADSHPLVSRHLPDIIEVIEGLVAKGAAYEIDGNVFFSVRKFKGYGKLSGRTPDEMISGSRIEVDQRKQDPLDFALWKAARPGEAAWESPWGKGRPGWHIECSTMACKYLGYNFDIHGGGFDLIFPHHENEIAQAEAYSGKNFCRYWLHNGMITVKEEKMSKSLGNFFLVREILEKFPGDVVRFLLLSTHYRSPLDFDFEKLESAQKGLERLRNSYNMALEKLRRGDFDNSGDLKVKAIIADTKDKFIKAMDDDFNTALALGIIFDFSREANGYLRGAAVSCQTLEEIANCYEELVTKILGINLKEKAAAGEDKLIDGLMGILIEIRQKARFNKDWAAADGIRDQLNELGIVLEDTPQGVRWKRK